MGETHLEQPELLKAEAPALATGEAAAEKDSQSADHSQASWNLHVALEYGRALCYKEERAGHPEWRKQ